MVLVGNGQSKQATRYSTFEFVHVFNTHYKINYFSLEILIFGEKGNTADKTLNKIHLRKKLEKLPKAIKFKRSASASTTNGEYRIFSFSNFKMIPYFISYIKL